MTIGMTADEFRGGQPIGMDAPAILSAHSVKLALDSNPNSSTFTLEINPVYSRQAEHALNHAMKLFQGRHWVFTVKFNDGMASGAYLINATD